MAAVLRAGATRYRFPVACFVAWRLVHAAGVAATGRSPVDVFDFDGFWYRRILRDGYAPVDGEGQSTAFFPLLPWLTRLVQVVVRSELASALVVMTVVGLAATVLVYEAGRRWRSEDVGRWATLAFLAFPTSLFLWQFYTEALFIALSAAALLTQRRRPWLAGCLAFAVAMTRVPGILVVPALLAGHRQDRGRLDRTALWYLLGLAGPLPVMAAQRAGMGDPLAFLDSQRAWDRHPSLPWTPLVDAVRALVVHGDDRLGAPLDVLAALLFVGLVVLAFRRPWPWSARTLLVLMVAVPLCSGLAASMGRFMLAAWPGFLVAGERLAEASPPVRVLVVGASAAVSLAVLSTWSHGTFVG